MFPLLQEAEQVNLNDILGIFCKPIYHFLSNMVAHPPFFIYSLHIWQKWLGNSNLWYISCLHLQYKIWTFYNMLWIPLTLYLAERQCFACSHFSAFYSYQLCCPHVNPGRDSLGSLPCSHLSLEGPTPHIPHLLPVSV